MNWLQVDNLFDVKGKVVLITGGSRGIGKMIATGFIQNGAKVYISSRSTTDCDTTAAELNALGPGTCIAIPADLQKFDETEKLAEIISSKEKALHVLVNNAGAVWAAHIDEYPDFAFTKVLTLNVQRVFTLTQLVLPLLRAGAAQGGKEGPVFKDPARIINIGSIEGLSIPDHETYAYTASKAALHQLSRHLGGKLGREGIVSNTIACGPFQSKMTAQSLKSFGEQVVAGIPLSRIGTTEDVAGTALYLASRAGAFVNGATIVLDGGLLVNMPTGKL